MTPSTSAIVGTSRPRSPCNARRAASIAYDTDETGSPITANANATSRTGRLRKMERTATAGIRRETKKAHLSADQTSRHASDVPRILQVNITAESTAGCGALHITRWEKSRSRQEPAHILQCQHYGPAWYALRLSSSRRRISRAHVSA